MDVAALQRWTISTHALTWRATISVKGEVEIEEISTHALTWRATGNLKEEEQ